MESHKSLISKYQAIIFFLFFYCALVYCFFVNPIVFVSFFRKQTNRPFFTVDINVCVKQFINISFFVVYLLYMPFIIWILLVSIISSSSAYLYHVWFQFIIGFVYIHYISIIYSQYDFINFYQNSIFNVYVEGIDLAYIILQYKGFFWDFFFCFSTLISYIIFIFNFPEKSIIYIYSQNVIKFVANRAVFFKTWAVRMCVYILIYYFFSGESYMNDIIIFIFSIIFVERIFITFRFFFFISIFNNNMLN